MENNFKRLHEELLDEASEGAMKMAQNVAKKSKKKMSDADIEKLAAKFDAAKKK